MTRPRLKPLRERNPIPIAIISLLILALLGLAAYRADDLPLIGGGTSYTAHFSEAAGLKDGQEVRVAGVKAGKVTGVSLDGPKVKVTFRVKEAWVGNASTLAIMIKTLLGSKYLALDPLGTGRQNPRQPIGLDRTIAPYDVTAAFDDLGSTLERLDTGKMAESLTTISETFANTPPRVRTALNGLSALSKTISSRDAELARLLAGTKQLSGTLADQNTQFEALFRDGNLLLEELRRRRGAIHALLVGTRDLAVQLSGLVEDNRRQLAPTLASLDRVTDVLARNAKSLDRALALTGTYARLAGNALGNGRWTDGYSCGSVPRDYLVGGKWDPPLTGCLPTRRGGAR